jgi:hypothetical protein
MWKTFLLLGAWAALLACGGGRTTTDCDTTNDCPKDYPYVCQDGRCVPAGGGGSDSSAGGDSSGGGDQTPSGDAVIVIGDDGNVGPDLLGPTIEIDSPGPYEMVGQYLFVSVTIDDEGSGVDPASVAVTITGAIIEAGQPPATFTVPVTNDDDGSQYVGVFNTLQLGALLYPAIVVVARDNAGNESEQGHSFTLDNQPPVVALTSPDVQLWKEAEPTSFCSNTFDPLGASSVKMGDVIKPTSTWGMLIYPRVRIEDQGNGESTGLATLPKAGVDDTTTLLYILDQVGLQAGHRLVSGGATCTRIDPAAIPDPGGRLATQAVVQRLVPVPASGAGDFSTAPPADSPCIVAGMAAGNEPEPPKAVCKVATAAGITYWYRSCINAPAVYVANAYASTDLELCTGGPYDTRTLADGAACLAAVATDNVGNSAVSAPIAICIDRDNSGDCVGFNPANVACSDGCVAQGFSGISLREQ